VRRKEIESTTLASSKRAGAEVGGKKNVDYYRKSLSLLVARGAIPG